MAEYWQKWSDALRRFNDAHEREQKDKLVGVVRKAVKDLMDFATSTGGQMATMLLGAADEKITIAVSDAGEVRKEYALTRDGFMMRRVGHREGMWRPMEYVEDFGEMLHASVSLKGVEFLKDPVAALRARLDRIADDLQRKYAKL